VLTLSNPISDEREIDESREHHVPFFEPGKDAAEAFEAAERALNFVSAFVHFTIIFPWLKAIAPGRDDRNETQVERELPGLLTFIRLIHYEVQWSIGPPKALQQGASFWRIPRLARGTARTLCVLAGT
jgi:hypothetical protein